MPVLTAAQRAHFRTKGWLVVPEVFPSHVVKAIGELAWRVGEQAAAEPGVRRIDVEGTIEGRAVPRKVRLPFLAHRDFRKFVLNRRLVNLVSELLGGRAMVFWDHIFMKPPRIGSPTYYHQDNFDFRCTPKQKMLTAWIALDDVDEENGCLRYISGSNRERLYPHGPVPEAPSRLGVSDRFIDYSREEPAPVPKGGVVFHSSHTLHSSRENTSDRWRRGYATHWVTSDVRSTSGALDAAYFKAYARDWRTR